MSGMTNEILFYGGIGIAAISAIACIIHFIVSKFKAFRLKTQLILEYGEQD